MAVAAKVKEIRMHAKQHMRTPVKTEAPQRAFGGGLNVFEGVEVNLFDASVLHEEGVQSLG